MTPPGSFLNTSQAVRGPCRSPKAPNFRWAFGPGHARSRAVFVCSKLPPLYPPGDPGTPKKVPTNSLGALFSLKKTAGDGSGTSPFFSLGAHLVQNVFPASKMLPKCRPKEPQRIPKSIDPRSDAFDLLGGGFMIPPPFPPSHRPRTGQPTQNMQNHTCFLTKIGVSCARRASPRSNLGVMFVLSS